MTSTSPPSAMAFPSNCHPLRLPGQSRLRDTYQRRPTTHTAERSGPPNIRPDSRTPRTYALSLLFRCGWLCSRISLASAIALAVFALSVRARACVGVTSRSIVSPRASMAPRHSARVGTCRNFAAAPTRYASSITYTPPGLTHRRSNPAARPHGYRFSITAPSNRPRPRAYSPTSPTLNRHSPDTPASFAALLADSTNGSNPSTPTTRQPSWRASSTATDPFPHPRSSTLDPRPILAAPKSRTTSTGLLPKLSSGSNSSEKTLTRSKGAPSEVATSRNIRLDRPFAVVPAFFNGPFRLDASNSRRIPATSAAVSASGNRFAAPSAPIHSKPRCRGHTALAQPLH